METIIIQTNSKSTSKLLLNLSKKLGEKADVLAPEIAEDLALGIMMQKLKTENKVSKDRILSALKV